MMIPEIILDHGMHNQNHIGRYHLKNNAHSSAFALILEV